VLDTFSRGQTVLLYPAIGYYESCNAIVKARRDRRISAAEADQAIQDLFSLGLRTVGSLTETQDPLRHAYPISVKYQRSVYDAIYLVLAEALAAPLITADRPLQEAAQADFDIVWIEEFSLDA